MAQQDTQDPNDMVDGVTVMIGGEERTLKYTRRTMYLMEVKAERTLGELFEDLDKGGVRALVELVWAGLQHDRKYRRTEPLDVAEWIGLDDLEAYSRIANAVTLALAPVVPKAQKELEKLSEDEREDHEQDPT